MTNLPTTLALPTVTRLTAGATLAVLALQSTAHADVRLPALFSDGMVLQRGAAVTVWGWADPGEEVSVKGGWLGSWIRAEVTKADETGHWQLEIRTPEDAGKTTLSVSCSKNSITVKDVLLGEVWLCSGQSNMEWRLSTTLAGVRDNGLSVEGLDELDRPNIRFFEVPRRVSMDPTDDCSGKWVTATGEDALRCSSVSYFFACALQDQLDVPVGLVVSSWGGTPAQAWTSAEVVARFPDHGAAMEAIRTTDNHDQETRVAEFWDSVDGLDFFTARFRESAFDDGHWEEQVQPATFEAGPVGPHDGVVWYRRTVDVPERWLGEDLELQLPAIDDADQTFWNGEEIGTTVKPGGHTQPRRYAIPANQVRAGMATIAIRALDTGGPGGFAAATMQLKRGEEFIDLAGPWRVRKGAAATRIPRLPFPVTANQNTPSALFNGMITPLVPFAVQGVIWYQGESNRKRAREYRALFPAMIVDWRTQWNQPELPFYFAQIAPYNYRDNDRENSKIAQLREAQALATRLPRTGMVLTADIGNPRDIHPVNKWDVGRRFARFALRDVYGKLGIEPDGPTISGATREGGTLHLTFAHVGDALSVRGESLDHFEVAGPDGAFVPAVATIGSDGVSVDVRADGVAEPAQVRYLWSDAAEATLMGGHGLPAAPFRFAL